MDVSVLLIEQMLLNDSEWLTSFNFVIDIHTCWEEDCAHIGTNPYFILFCYL